MRTLLIIAMAMASQGTASAELQLAGIFGESMVLQRGESVPIWGTTDPGQQLTVSFADQSLTVKADEIGKWQVTFSALKFSEIPRQLTVTCGDQTLLIRDVVVGDVWHASGQSNMAMSVASVAKRLPKAQTDIAQADLPGIRFRLIKERDSSIPREDLPKRNWTKCTPQSVPALSATAFYFARNIHQTVGVPIGIIESSRGGTPIEPFIPRSAFESHPTLQRELELGDQENLQELRKLPGGVYARDGNWLPSRLFHSRIAPITGFPVRGLIWYQAESNCGRGEDPRDYQYKMRALVQGWRTELSRPDMPIYFVQLPGYSAGDSWPYMREQQRLSAQEPNTGMVVTIDLLDPDIHGANKIDVGNRLALWALAKTYGKAIPFSGPLFDRADINDGSVTVHFRYAESGLMIAKKEGVAEPVEIPDGTPAHVELVGADGVWQMAEATIKNSTLVAKCDQVRELIAIRYGYASSPQHCNLYNRDGLPASPFCSRPELLNHRPAVLK